MFGRVEGQYTTHKDSGDKALENVLIGLEVKTRGNQRENCFNHLEKSDESLRADETCCHSELSEKQPVKTDEKNFHGQ